MVRQGLLLVISGPSGCGKGTLCGQIAAGHPEINISVSATTRPPRSGEVQGVNYYFMSRQEFEQKIEDDDFLEWAPIYGYYYGTPLAAVQEMMARGQDVILEIDVQGGLKVKEKLPGAVLIFIAPPSLQELERRLKGRGTENEEELNKRLTWVKTEMEYIPRYDYLVINDSLQEAVATIESIIVAERCRPVRISSWDELL